MFIIYSTIIENNTLIIEGNNTPNNTTRGEAKDPNYIAETLPVVNSFQYLLSLNAPILVPLLPNNDSTISSSTPGYHERYARQLSRNSVNPDIHTNPAVHSKEDPIYRTDLQILCAKELALHIIYEKTGIEMEEKALLYGFSTPGNLAVRLAFLHPEHFCGVIAGGINATIPLPLARYQGCPLPYPVGTYDYKQITGKDFDYNNYMNLNQFYFMGEKENPAYYNTVLMPLYYDADIKEVYHCISLDLYNRLDKINEIYKTLGCKENRIKVYKGFEHTVKPAEEKIKEIAMQWMKENQYKYHR